MMKRFTTGRRLGLVAVFGAIVRRTRDSRSGVSAWALSLVMFAVVALSGGRALAVTKTWTGAVDNLWNVAGNWSPVGVPAAADDVVVPAGVPEVLVNTTPALARSMILRSNLRAESVGLRFHGGGLSLENVTVTLATCCGSETVRTVFIGGAQLISGSGIIRTANLGFQYAITAQDCSLTIGAGITLLAAEQNWFLDTSGTGTLTIDGTVEARNGRQWILGGNITNYDQVTSTLTGGTWKMMGGNIVHTFPNNGSVLAIGPNTTFVFGNGQFQNANLITQNDGTIEATLGADITFSPGVGARFINNGTIKLGQGSICTINAEYRQSATGVLDLTMGGLNTTLQQSRLGSNSVVRLNGTCRTTFVGNFMPDCGDLFTQIQGTSRIGDFASTLYTLPSGFVGTTDYLNTGSRLRVTTTDGTCPNLGDCDDIDFNNDGVLPDSGDIEAFLRVFSGGMCNP